MFLFFFSFFIVISVAVSGGSVCMKRIIVFDALVNASIQSFNSFSHHLHALKKFVLVVILWLPGPVVILWLPVFVDILWLPVLVVLLWLPVLVVILWLPVLVVTLWWLPLTMVFWSSDSRTTSWTISSLVRGCVTLLASSWTSAGWLGHKMTSRIQGSILGCCPSLLVPNIFMDAQFLWLEDELEWCLVTLKI